MWTKREMVEFKDAIRKEGGDAIIKVCTHFHPKVLNAQCIAPLDIRRILQTQT